MTRKFHFLFLGAALLATPALAQNNGRGAPTADSAASQVGQAPPAALDEHGKHVEPSQKLWNNPRTVAEQPGTQPPTNDKPANAAKSAQQSLTGDHAYQPEHYKGAEHSTQNQPHN